ncbi:indole-3-glycerol-phosphate synthase [Candidatus Woesearchaeota archaeon]|nr:indole-3-glycerol-phosphate synthase [Candidatus Woesearchaeota archaeon]
MDILDRFISQAGDNLRSGYYEACGTEKRAAPVVSLRKRLDLNDFSIIAEIKHASPAGEYEFVDIDVEKAALEFRHAGADAISVVVEPVIFKGNLNNIPIAKKAGLPVLFKDFVISDAQIKAASGIGADCILLIAKVAGRLNLDIDAMIGYAHSYGLEVLLECYDTGEMERALLTKADILGINNRDLQSLKVSLNRTPEILSSFSNISKPVISESGIRSRTDAEFLRASGARGILVGTSLWLSNDKAAKIRELKL